MLIKLVLKAEKVLLSACNKSFKLLALGFMLSA
jgi:hypothetical protein